MSEQDDHLRDMKAALERAIQESKKLTEALSADLKDQTRQREEHRLDKRALRGEDD